MMCVGCGVLCAEKHVWLPEGLCGVRNSPMPSCEIELVTRLVCKHLYPLSRLASLPNMILFGKIHIPHKIILKSIIPWFCVFLRLRQHHHYLK